MKCLICMQAEIFDGFTSVAFERGEFRLVIHHVPARVCPNCGDAYVDEDTAACLLSHADDALDEGLRGDEREY